MTRQELIEYIVKEKNCNRETVTRIIEGDNYGLFAGIDELPNTSQFKEEVYSYFLELTGKRRT
jgi:hypothetical protein